jgi:hypothetical protein
MIDARGATTDAFELLCSCKASNAAAFICVYGEDFAPDAQAVDQLATVFPVTRWPIRGSNQHNAIATLVKKGKLRRFYREVLAFDKDAARVDHPLNPPGKAIARIATQRSHPCWFRKHLVFL